MAGEAVIDITEQDQETTPSKRGSRGRTVGITALSVFATLASSAAGAVTPKSVNKGRVRPPISITNTRARNKQYDNEPMYPFEAHPNAKGLVKNNNNLSIDTSHFSSNNTVAGVDIVIRNFNPYPEIVDTPAGAELSSSSDGMPVSPLLPKKLMDGAKALVRCVMPDPKLGEISGEYVLTGPGAYHDLTVSTKDFANRGLSGTELTDIEPFINLDTRVPGCK